MSTKLLLKQWAKELEKLGFTCEGARALRRMGLIEQSVSLQKSQKAEPNRIRMNLFISVRDQFLDPPVFIICLSGHVSPTAAGFAEFEAWWSESQLIKSGLAALISYGIPWFEKFGSNEHTLSCWLEQAVSNNSSVQDLIESPKNTHPDIQQVIQKHLEATVQRAPRDYDRFLSLLKAHEGDRAAACKYARSYLESCKRLAGVFAGEPERTLQQLKDLGCGDVHQ